MIKKHIKRLIDFCLNALSKTATGRYIHRHLIEQAMSKTRLVRHADVTLSFVVPNLLNEYRVDSFSSKEPETLEWIDGFDITEILLHQ